MRFLERRWFRLTALIMAAVMFMVSLPVNAAKAGLVKTEDVIEQATATAQRRRVKDFVHRQDVRQQMTSLGIQPEEAAKRVDALSDADIPLRDHGPAAALDQKAGNLQRPQLLHQRRQVDTVVFERSFYHTGAGFFKNCFFVLPHALPCHQYRIGI